MEKKLAKHSLCTANGKTAITLITFSLVVDGKYEMSKSAIVTYGYH